MPMSPSLLLCSILALPSYAFVGQKTRIWFSFLTTLEVPQVVNKLFVMSVSGVSIH